MVKTCKKKKEKDPNAPRKPISAYFFFQRERREILKNEKPDFENRQIVALMRVEWMRMSNDEKKVYVDKSEEDKKRYEREIAIYNLNK